MNIARLIIIIVVLTGAHMSAAQDTFSIVAVDPTTREVGSAGASCVDLSLTSFATDHFLGQLLPGVGAINTQAHFDLFNQANATERMRMGDTPQQIIDWLVQNDTGNRPELRQYGVVMLVEASPQTAAHTGIGTDDFKGHITGSDFAIQGNILLSSDVLEGMRSNFISTQGDLADKLMAALQGAKRVGADTRCFANGTSSLFAYLKVAQPDDSFQKPSFVVSVRTSDGDRIEPIDSLQKLFNKRRNGTVLHLRTSPPIDPQFSLYPNPFDASLTIEISDNSSCYIKLMDTSRRVLYSDSVSGHQPIVTSHLPKGVYFLTIVNNRGSRVVKLIK